MAYKSKFFQEKEQQTNASAAVSIPSGTMYKSKFFQSGGHMTEAAKSVEIVNPEKRQFAPLQKKTGLAGARPPKTPNAVSAKQYTAQAQSSAPSPTAYANEILGIPQLTPVYAKQPSALETNQEAEALAEPRGNGFTAGSGGFGSNTPLGEGITQEDIIQYTRDEAMKRSLAAAEKFREDPTQYRLELAAGNTTEAVSSLQEAEETMQRIEAEGQALATRKNTLDAAETALQSIYSKYEQSGSDVDARAYLLAAEQLAQNQKQFQEDLARYQKDASATYDQYTSAYQKVQKAQTAYEKSYEAYLDDHLAVKYQDADTGEIYQVLQAIRSKIQSNAEKSNESYDEWGGSMDSFSKEQRKLLNQYDDLNALYKQKLLEQDNGAWNSGPVEFIDRTLAATQAGQMDWTAGMAELDRKVGNWVLRAASATLGAVADMTGSDSMKKKSEELLEKSKSTSQDVEDARKASQEYLQEALTGTGKIDGWIIQQMESVGAMWMDLAAAGVAGAAGISGGPSSLQIMGTRAAGSAMLDAHDKGYSEMEQVMVGVASGALEVISEKLFGGNPIYDADKGFVNQMVESVTQNPTILRLMYSKGFDIMGEGLEEVFTEILDPVAEYLLTDSADVDWASPDEIAQAFAGGVFLGLMGAGVDTAVDAVANSGTRKAWRELGEAYSKADAVQEVVQEGMAADPKTDAYQIAVKLQKKLDAGREITVRELGKQLMANQEAINAGLLVDQEVAPVQDAPEGALRDPEEGFYAILVEADEKGKVSYRLAEVRPDGDITYRSETETKSFYGAKLAAEIQGMNIRQIGTSASLRAAVEAWTAEAGETRAEGSQTETAADEAHTPASGQASERATSESRPFAQKNDNEAEIRAQSLDRSADDADPVSGPPEAQLGNTNDSADVREIQETAPYGGGTGASTVQDSVLWAGNMTDANTMNGGNDNGAEEQAAMGNGRSQERGYGGDHTGSASGSQRSQRRKFAQDTLRRTEEARRVQANVQALGGDLVSLREQGLSSGSVDRNLRVVLKEAWTEEVRDAAEIAESEGLEFVPLTGNMYARHGKGESRINGAIENGKIFVKADSTNASAREITMHEIFHEKASKDPTLVPKLIDLIQEKYGQEETEAIFQRYYDTYQDIYSDRASDEALAEMVWEELLADAYAEFQRYVDADASQFGMEVQEAVWNNSNSGNETEFKRFSLEGYEDDIQELLEQGIQQAATMEPVREMSGTEFAKGEKNLADQVSEYFDSVGNKAVHPILGEVELTRRGVKNDMAHGMGRKKAITFMAVPDVIEKGGMIDYQENWKGRGYDTAVVAAAVKIAGEDYMMGVVLNRYSEENQFYVHEVLAEASEGTTPFKTGTIKDGTPGGDAPSILTLLRKVLNVKREKIRYSLESREDQARDRAERKLANGLGDIMSMPQSAIQELREGTVRQIMEEYQKTGEVNQERLAEVLSEAFAKGLVTDDEFYKRYKPVKDYLRSQALTISEQDRADISDFTQFRKRAFGTLKIVNQGGLPVDAAYQELQETAPELFPADITHPADQLLHMYEVGQSIKKVQMPLERAMGENSEQFFDWAQKKMNALVEKTLEKYSESVSWSATAKQQGSQQISEEAREAFERGEVEGAQDIQWAGQETIPGAESEVKATNEDSGASPLERAANGSVRDWIQYVLGGSMTPEEFAEMNRNARAKELSGRAAEEAEKILNRKTALDGVRQDGMTDEELSDLIMEFEVNRDNRDKGFGKDPVDEIIIRKADFTGTPSMEKLGIKIEGSVARYRQTESLISYENAANQAAKVLKKRIQKLHATEQEQFLANAIVKGVLTADALDDSRVDVEVVAELADYFMAANSFKLDMIAQRRAEINTANYRIAQDMFRDSEAYRPQLRGILSGATKIVMNERTPERVVKQIFGKEQGGKIYETYFRPVWVNGAEMSRFEGRMLDRVREFTDQTGRKRALTEQEREMAQRLMEGQATRDIVEGQSYEDAKSDKNAKDAEDKNAARRISKDAQDRVKAVAQNLRNGADFTDQIREWGMVGDEYLQGLAQAYTDYLDAVTVSQDMDQTILKNSIDAYRAAYDELYLAINDFLVSHGYKPVGFIPGYAPHFQKREVQNGLFGALKSLGVEKESASELPASIAGRTADFKPNMKWNPHFQSRKGTSTSYDIAAGYEQYIHYVAEMFYHTDDVMRIRQAVNYFRQAYSGEEISMAIEDAKVDQFKDAAWKKEYLERIGKIQPGTVMDDRDVNEAYEQYVNGLFEQAKPENLQKYSEFVTWMDNYANIVAGKQSMADRGIEYGGGRNALNIGSKLMRRFASANVAGNLSSVLNQTAQLPLIQQQLGTYMERAVWDMARGTMAKENFSERSDFLTDKRGVEKLTTDGTEKFISMLFKPAEMMDRMVSTLAVRGRYLQALGQGMTAEQAMKEADDFGRRVMGSRMKGAKPLAYESKTFVNQMIHVFQVEASNTFDYMALSDMPQAVKQVYKTKGKAAGTRYLASYIVGYLLSAFLLNQLTDKLYGGTPAPFDLIGWTLNFVAGGWGMTDEEFVKTVTDDGLEKIIGERLLGTERIDKSDGLNWAGSLSNLGYDLSNDLPYVRNVAGVMGWGDQSLPTVGINEFAESLGDAGKSLWSQIFGGQEETGLTWAGTAQRVGEDLLEAGTQVMPGGRQLKKTAQGIKTMLQGGVTSGYGDSQRLQYPVNQNIWNWARAIGFGNIALPEYDAYYASGNSPLTAGQTQKVKELEDLGIDKNVSYELYQEFREINNDLEGVEASTAKRNAINALDLTDEQKLEVFDRFFLDHTADSYEKTRNEYQAMLDAGLTWDEITQAHNEYAALDADEDMKATEKATALAAWADQQGWNSEQTQAVKNRFQFWSMLPAEASNYEKFTVAGLQADSSERLTELLAGLAPEDGAETVSVNQKVLAIQGSDLTSAEKVQAIAALSSERRERLVEAGVSDETAKDLAAAFAVAEAENGDESLSAMEKARYAVDISKSNSEAMEALSTILQESTYKKLETASKYGVMAEEWVQYKEEWTATYGDDSVSQEKLEKVLDKMNLNNRQKAALWQIAKKSWKPANNPYSTSVGKEIYDLMNAE